MSGRLPPAVEQGFFLLGASLLSFLSGPGITGNSDAVVTLITPVNEAFAIWALIFLILAAVTFVPQWIKFDGMIAGGIKTKMWLESDYTRYWLMLCFGLLGSWGYIFNLRPSLNSYFPSVCIIALALYTAILAKGTNSYSRSAGPLSLLIVWLSWATAVNIAVWLKADFGVEDNEWLAAGTMLALVAVTILACYFNKDWVFLLGTVYVLGAIYLRHGSWVPLVMAGLALVGSGIVYGNGRSAYCGVDG